MPTMVIKMEGIDTTIGHISAFADKMAEGLPDTMADIGTTLGKYYSGQAFASQGGVYEKPWAPLAAATVAEKSKNWPGRPPLVRTGDLQNGFHFDATPFSVTVSNKVEVTGKNGTYNLLSIHQHGTHRGIPPRLIMALNDTLIAQILAKVRAAVVAKLEETQL